MSERGELKAIWRKRDHGGPMEALERARVRAGSGLEGNAGHGRRRQITIVEVDAWERATRTLGVEVDPSARRANLLVSGPSLADSRDKVLAVGTCRIRILGETRPCSLMDEAAPGLKAALGPDWGAGAYGEVLEDCEVAVGDPVRWEETSDAGR